MKFLHTSDWHVGKTLKGTSRIEEHREVLGEVVQIAEAERVDLAIVAGDMFDSAAPVPEASAVVFEALLALRDTGASVVAIAGNHDHPGQFEALRPVMAAAGITMLGHAHRPEDVAWSTSPRRPTLPAASTRPAPGAPSGGSLAGRNRPASLLDDRSFAIEVNIEVAATFAGHEAEKLTRSDQALCELASQGSQLEPAVRMRDRPVR